MTKVEKELCRIMDTGTDISLAYKEAVNKEKLLYTYMIVNGEQKYVTGFNLGDNLVLLDGESPPKCETLEVFLPETGTYLYEGAALAILKNPIKAWNKSFKVGGQWICSSVPKFNKLLYSDLAKATRYKFIIDKAGRVLYFTRPVGMYNKEKNELSCTDYIFYQDLLDFSKKAGFVWKES